jgi:hypothetical protein
MDALTLRDSIDILVTVPEAGAQQVVPLAQAYARACGDVRIRLRRCAEHLDRGMIREAVQLAEVSPSLLPLAKSLELRDLAKWNQLCVMNGQPPVPAIDGTILERLSSAITLVAKLDPLLTRHHLAALSHAPIRDRIDVLRHLRAQDPLNPSWAEQLRLLEPQRIEELRTLIAQLPRLNDERQVRALAYELRSSHWTVAIDESWIRSAAKRLAELSDTAAIAMLPLAELREAYESRSYDRIAAALREWQRVVYEHGPSIPAELLASAREISRLFATESRRRTHENPRR